MKIKILDRNNEIKKIIDGMNLNISYEDDCDLVFINVDQYGLKVLKDYEKCRKVIIIETLDYLYEVLSLQGAYLIKRPLEIEYLVPLIQKIYSEFNEIISIKTKKGVIEIPYKEISYIASDRRLLYFYLKDKKEIRVYGKLNDIEKILKNDFIRIHQSYLIYREDIEKIDGMEVKLYSYPYTIPISKSKYKNIVSLIAD